MENTPDDILDRPVQWRNLEAVQKCWLAHSWLQHNSKSAAAKVKPGDVFLCYLTGVMRWVGALRVAAASKNTDPIWGKGLFPIRFEVEPIIELEPEYGIPMAELEGKVAFYQGAKDRGKFKGIIRKSLNPLSAKDGELIFNLLDDSKINPNFLPVDPNQH
jgi:hypothetical protein